MQVSVYMSPSGWRDRVSK